MAFRFNPKTDEEINAIQNQALLPDGVYSFFVKGIEEQVSKTGNQMLKLRLLVIGHDKSERYINDFLLITDKMIFKLKHFCETIGFEKEYLAGMFDLRQCINRSGRARIGIQKGSAKEDGSGYYPDKNAVKDYVTINLVKPTKASVAAPIATADPDLNDDISF